VSFVPLQIIITLFWLIICTFCSDISFKCWIFTQPHVVFPPRFFSLYGVPMYVESYNFYHTDSFIYLLLMCHVLLTCYVFVLRSYVCNIRSSSQDDMILMGHPVSSCHVPVVRSCFILFHTFISSWKFCYVHLSLHVITLYIVPFSHLYIST